MKLRILGKTGFLASEVCFGGASVSGEGGGYGFGQISESSAIELLREASHRGINLFDTAPCYGFGMSEQRFGMAFKDMREKVFLVSKGGVTWNETKRLNVSNAPEVIERMLEQSLKDLKTDYIDLYFIHWPDERVEIRRPMEVLVKAQRQGRIKHIGLSNTRIEEIEKASQVGEIAVVQNEFNFFAREAAESLFPYLELHNIGFMSYGTLDKGILSGRTTPGRKYDPSDLRSKSWWKGRNLDLKFQQMDIILPILQRHGYTGLEFALGFNLRHSLISTALCGIKSSSQLDSLCEALDHLPGKEVYAEVEKNIRPMQK